MTKRKGYIKPSMLCQPDFIMTREEEMGGNFPAGCCGGREAGTCRVGGKRDYRMGKIS